MQKETIAEIMLRKRLKERRTSLDHLAKITERDKATVRKYEKEELHIPAGIAKKLAAIYFDTPKERKQFLQQYEEEILVRQSHRFKNRNRKKERTVAGKKYDAVLRIVPLKEKSVDMKDDMFLIDSRYSYKGIAVIIDILEKYTRKKVCSVYPNEFLMHGKNMNGKQSARNGSEALKALLKFSRERELGIHALMDLALAKVELSDLFDMRKYESNQSKGADRYYLVEDEELAKMVQIIDSTYKPAPRDGLDALKVHLKYLRSRGSELSVMKEKLIASIQHVVESLTKQAAARRGSK
jgi:transcriptional regulator with XRE-family HTH domain